MIDKETLQRLVWKALDNFYERRINTLSGLKLKKTLKRKNPYLFRAVGTEDANEIVESMLLAYMSSSDEGIFGDAFFEPLAKAVSGGKVAPSPGVDIAVETDAKYTAIAVKSGPSVFNAQSKGKQNQQFQALRSRLMKLQKHFDAIVGYSYGQKITEPGDERIFKELSGQAFWAELTGDEDFYLRIIDAMADRPKQHKARFQTEWEKAKNRFVGEFVGEFCHDDGSINWVKILEFNSGRKKSRAGKGHQ